MDGKRIGDLMRLLERDLRPGEREGLLDDILADPESAKMAQILSLPEFQVRNNLPLPFETPARFLAGCHEGYLLPLTLDNLGFGESTKGFLADLGRIIGAPSPRGIHRSLDLRLGSEEGKDALTLKLEPEVEGREINLSIRSGRDTAGNIEIWEAGVLSLRTASSALGKGAVFSIEPGTAIAIRRSGSEDGARILVAEVEFSSEDWKAAFVSSCLRGHLSDAFDILKNRLWPSFGAEEWLDRVRRQFSALTAVTKMDGCFLTPIPTTRDSAVNPNDRMHAYGLVWNGILQCWPSAARVPNPWSEGHPGIQSEIELDRDASQLVSACISAATEKSTWIAADDLGEPRAAEGWSALQGWTAMLSSDYRRANQIFNSTRATEGDPFSLGMSARLAEHLVQSSAIQSMEERPHRSSDEVWREILSPLM